MGATGWKLSEVQLGFTLFIAFETWLMPLSGWFMDRFARVCFMTISAVLCGVGWAGLGYAKTLTELYAYIPWLDLARRWFIAARTTVGLSGSPTNWDSPRELSPPGLVPGLPCSSIHGLHYSSGELPGGFLYTGIAQGIVIFAWRKF